MFSSTETVEEEGGEKKKSHFSFTQHREDANRGSLNKGAEAKAACHKDRCKSKQMGGVEREVTRG